MPHDKNGQVIYQGDKVIVRATVQSVTTGEECCNVTLEIDEVMFPGINKCTIVVNAKQVEKV